jgi:hypothetical protein
MTGVKLAGRLDKFDVLDYEKVKLYTQRDSEIMGRYREESRSGKIFIGCCPWSILRR